MAVNRNDIPMVFVMTHLLMRNLSKLIMDQLVAMVNSLGVFLGGGGDEEGRDG